MKKRKLLAVVLTLATLCTIFSFGMGAVTVSAAVTETKAVSTAAARLENRSTINKRQINGGDTLTISAVPYGGTAPYHYKYYYRYKDTYRWELLDQYTDKTKLSRKTSKSGYYYAKVVISDSNGASAEKIFPVTVVKATGNPMVNASKLSQTAIELGESVELLSTVRGGTKPYTYTYSVKEYNGTKVDLASDRAADSYIFTPDAPGYYTVTFTAKDMDGNTAQKDIKLDVTKKESTALANNSFIRNNVITAGNELVVNGSPAGGTAPYRYSYYYKLRSTNSWLPLSVNNKSNVFTYKFDEPGYYDFLVRATDHTGTRKDKKLQFAVTKDTGLELKNTSTLSKTKLEPGETITMNASAEGGKAPYRYRYYVRFNNGEWTRIEGYTPKDSITYKPTKQGLYTAKFMIADANNEVVEKEISFNTSNYTGQPMYNNISVSATALYAGQRLTIKGIASGGYTPYQYKFYYRIGASGWTVLRDYDYSDTFSLNLDDPGAYTFRVAVKYGDNAVAVKDVEVDVISSTRLTVNTTSPAMKSARWADDEVMTVSAGTTVELIQKYGRWYRIRYNGKSGWMYNLAFTGGSNYSDITTSNLPIVADDIIFQNGRGIKPLYDYVTYMSYRAMDKDTVENMCVFMLKYKRGACYQRAALLYYLLDRAGYEVIRVNDGIDDYTGGGPHNWVIINTSYGWRHIDPTPVRGLSIFYLVCDKDISPYFTWDRIKYPVCK